MEREEEEYKGTYQLERSLEREYSVAVLLCRQLYVAKLHKKTPFHTNTLS